MLEKFHEKSRAEIASLLGVFLERDFFAWFPELHGRVAVIAVGSVGSGNYDRLSDVDVEVVCWRTKEKQSYDAKIKAYKAHVRELGEPVQFMNARLFDELAEACADWRDDQALRTYAQALVIVDQGKKFASLQRRIRYYPAAVWKEKIRWLFAEAVFKLRDRFDVALERGDRYYGEVVKLQLLRLLMNAMLMSAKNFPAFDKHVYKELKKTGASEKFLTLVDDIVSARELREIRTLLETLKSYVESRLIRQKIIAARPDRFWVDYRAKFQVKLD